MTAYPLTAIVLLLIVALQIWLMFRVARQRGLSGIEAPAMTGNADLERAVRVHMNTVEQLAIFLPALAVCGAYAGDRVTAAIGLTWVVGRIWYAIGYQQAAAKRSNGFLVTFLALAAAALVGAYGVLMSLLR